MNEHIEIKIKKLILKARQSAVIAQEDSARIFQELQKYIPDLSSYETNAPNADNLEDAVSCFIDYGEHDINDLLKEISTTIDNEGEKENE